MDQIPNIGAMSLGLTSVFSQMGVPSKYKPVIALLIAIGVAVLYVGLTKQALVVGLLGGLGASGLYSGVSATFKKEDKPLVGDFNLEK
jgi:hypothetical protein